MGIINDYSNVDNVVKYFETSTNLSLSGHRGSNCLDFNCNGEFLASCSPDDSYARIWNVREGEGVDLKPIVEIKGHEKGIDYLCWNPIGTDNFATCCEPDSYVRLWDMRSKKLVNQIQTSGWNMVWSPDGNYMVITTHDDEISLIDIRTNTVILKQKYKFQVNDLKFHPGGKYLFMACERGKVEIVEIPSLSRYWSLSAHVTNNSSIDFDPNKRHFAVGSHDALVSIWDCNEWCCVKTLRGLNHPVRFVCFNWNGKILASGSIDSFIDISHIESGKSLYHIPIDKAVSAMTWHPKKDYFAYSLESSFANGPGQIKILKS